MAILLSLVALGASVDPLDAGHESTRGTRQVKREKAIRPVRPRGGSTPLTDRGRRGTMPHRRIDGRSGGGGEMTERLFTTHQVADLLGATGSQVQQWMASGLLAVLRLPDGAVRVSEHGLVRFLKERGVDIEGLMATVSAQDVGAAEPESRLQPASKPRPGVAGASSPGPSPTPAAPDAETPEPQAVDREAPVDAGERAALLSGTSEEHADAAGPAGPWEDLLSYVADRTERPAAQAPRARPQPAPPEPPPAEPEETAVPEAAVLGEVPSAEEVPPQPPSPSAAPGEAGATDADVAGASTAAGQVVHAVLSDAVRRGATHVHLELHGARLVLRLRVDGLLHEKANFARRLPEGLAPRVLDRLLALAGLAAADRSLPQSGRLELEGPAAGGATFELSSVPTDQGLRVVVRVSRQAPSAGLMGVADAAGALVACGLGAPEAAAMDRLLRAEGGGLFVVAARARAAAEMLGAMALPLCRRGRSVVSIASSGGPTVPGASRLRIDPFAGLTPASAARAALSQDADAIVLEQIRDPASAVAAVEAALAGAAVLAGVPAGGAGEAVRLLGAMGAEPWPLSLALKAVVTFRRLRRVCDECRRPAEASPQLAAAIGLPAAELPLRLYTPVGCTRCGQTGYRGVVGLASVVPAAGALAEAIRYGSVEAIARATAAATRTLEEAALAEVRAGAVCLRDAVADF